MVPSAGAVSGQSMETSDASVVRSHEDFAVVAAAAARAITFQPNTTYLMCNNVQQITPPASADLKEDPSAPTLISFVIPPDSLSGGRGGSNDTSGRPKRELLEVTCRVVGVNVLPMPTPGVIDSFA